MEAILEELRALREIVASLQVHSPPDNSQICEGVTGKGTVCRNRAVLGASYCRMHGERCERSPKPERVPKKPKKPKKIQPEHNHGIGEDPIEPCQLCETHGDVWDPKLPECCFEGNNICVE